MKTLLSILILAVIAVGGWYWYMGARDDLAPLNADLYPLYSGATWGDSHAKETDSGPAYERVSKPFTDVTDIAAVSTPFTKYYDEKLTAAGWVRDMMREAGGPGAEVSTYTKGDQFIIVSFQSVFKVKHPDAPSECPCDVTFSLMSGTQVGPTPAEQLAARTYHDSALGFFIVLPTAIATSKSDTLWSVDTQYVYQAQGPNKTIPGVKFTIPTALAAGTNLSSDSYVSVEHLPAQAGLPAGGCSASAFMLDTSIKSHTVKEGVLSYSVASSSDAGAGNRYDETVYVRSDLSPTGECIAVRYFIHYGAIQNFPEGQVREFDETALLQVFDQIRRTLTSKQ